MLWRNTKECVVSENSCSKNFLNFQEKHPSEIAFLSKVAGYLTLTGNVLLGNLWNFQNRFQETRNNCKCRLLQLVVTGKCFNQKMFFKKYLIWFDIQWHVLPGNLTIFHNVFLGLYLVCWVHFSSWFFSSGKMSTSWALSRLLMQFISQIKKF